MSRYTALLDANVLYPPPLRDVLMQLAVTDIFKAKWSEDIHREWIDALMRNKPNKKRTALERTRDLMNEATRDCLVTGYEALIPSLELPDPDDRHVLAAAIGWKMRCDRNAEPEGFSPQAPWSPTGSRTLHPDDFLSNHLALAPGLFCSALRKVRARLKSPPFTAEDYLANLTQQGLVATATELEQFKDLI